MIDNPCVISTTKMMLNNGKIQSCSVQCISKIYYCKNMSTDNHSHLTGIGKGKHYIPKTCMHAYPPPHTHTPHTYKRSLQVFIYIYSIKRQVTKYYMCPQTRARRLPVDRVSPQRKNQNAYAGT